MPIQLPDYRQANDWECGRTCFRILCHYWETPLPTSLADLSNPIAGLSPDAMWSAFLAMGFEVLCGNWTIPLLNAVLKTGKPVCCLTQLDGVGHWVVASKVTSKRVHFQCPTKGPTFMSLSEWEANWRDSHWTGSTFSNWGLCPYV